MSKKPGWKDWRGPYARKTIPRYYNSFFTFLWRQNLCFFLALLWLYWILFLFIWEVASHTGLLTSIDLCWDVVEIFQIKNFHHPLNYSFSCSRQRLILSSFQYLTEVFSLGEQSPSPPLTPVGTLQHLQRAVQVEGEMINLSFSIWYRGHSGWLAAWS